ncbi:MAG TPA: PLP-dependent aminotransferase family protein [Lapillicoccus sp.]|nr:PLP-dependent aminotransferase family protein [Lapillicoccus sp.]
MTVDWSRDGPELLLGLERSSGLPLARQLQERLRDAIRSGRLERGERLPASRALAAQLGVSRGVVVDTYAQLESEGYLRSAQGSGTVVASGGAEAPTPAPPRPTRPPYEVDFEYGVPDMRSFPMRDWLWAMGVAGRTATAADLGDELGAGSAQLRGVLAAYLRRVRGAVADPDAVVVCAGFRYGHNLVLRALLAEGVTTVAVEDPGPVDHDEIARRSGTRVVPVPVDELGLDVAALARTPARVVVTTPAHQAPTGVVLAPERRHALVEWANAVDGFVVEDDYDAEFRYDRQPVGAVQGLAPDRVLAMGSTSKTLSPTLRMGWLICPPRLREAVGVEKQLLGRGAPGLDQLALAALMESGRFDRHLRQMRTLYKRRREALVSSLARYASDVAVTGLAAGCHAVLRLPSGVTEESAVEWCAARSVAVYGMSRYRSDRGTEPAELVLGFGNVRETAIADAVRRVGPLLQGRARRR